MTSGPRVEGLVPVAGAANIVTETKTGKLMVRLFRNFGARILVEVPYKKAYGDRTHLRYFSPRKLRRLLSVFSKGVEVIHLKERRTIFAVVDV